MGLIDTLTSESGTFGCLGGIAHTFTPTAGNIVGGGLRAPAAKAGGDIHYEKAVRTFVVPHGVRGFCDRFMQGWAVTERFVLPETVESIGSMDAAGNVFAGCYLPEVVLPASLKSLGLYAFSGSYIRRLVVDAANRSPYGRQFKDSAIGQLCLPHRELELYRNGADEAAYGFYRNFFVHCRCTVTEY